MKTYGHAFSSFFQKQDIWKMLAFSLLFRFGYGFLEKMGPLFMIGSRETGGLGLNNEVLGQINGIFGTGAFMVGSILGGLIVARYGLRKTLFWLCLSMNVPNVVFVYLSFTQDSTYAVVATLVTIDKLFWGIGAVGLIVYMMQQVSPGPFRTAYYTFASAIMGLNMMATGLVSGWLAAAVGLQGVLPVRAGLRHPVDRGDADGPLPPPGRHQREVGRRGGGLTPAGRLPAAPAAVRRRGGSPPDGGAMNPDIASIWHPIDVAVLLVYFAAMVGIGLAVMKRASKGLDSYFLAGNELPWWVLGMSNASAMWDITGTMWLVYNIFVYGMKGVWLPWLWPTFNQVFLAVYLASWIRRSNVLTGAEWITVRFGEGRGAELSRISVVFFALVSVVGFIAYDFQGMGKFTASFLPWDLSPNTYGILIMAITAVYVLLGGMISVVLTDLAQFVIMAVCSVAIAVIAMVAGGAGAGRRGWCPRAGATSSSAGSWVSTGRRRFPSIMQNIEKDGYGIFGLFFMAMLFKGVLVSIAGPTPNYDMQRILAATQPARGVADERRGLGRAAAALADDRRHHGAGHPLPAARPSGPPRRPTSS